MCPPRWVQGGVAHHRCRYVAAHCLAPVPVSEFINLVHPSTRDAALLRGMDLLSVANVLRNPAVPGCSHARCECSCLNRTTPAMNHNSPSAVVCQRRSIAPFRKGGEKAGWRSILKGPGMEHYDALCDLIYVVVQGVFLWLASMPDTPSSLSAPVLLASCHANQNTSAVIQFVFMPGGGLDFWKFRGQALRTSDATSISDYMMILAGGHTLAHAQHTHAHPHHVPPAY